MDAILVDLIFGETYNTRLVVLGTSLLGLAAGLIGALAFLRRRALVSDALAHGALPGICLAFIIAVELGVSGRSLPILLTGALAGGVLAVFAIQFLSSKTRLGEDAASGAVLSVFFGAGIVLLSWIQNMGSGEEGGLGSFIFGQTAAMSPADLYLIILMAVSAIILVIALKKELILICFDADFAAVQGWPVSFMNTALLLLVSLVTIAGLQSVGLVLIVSLLIIPPAAARFWTERLGTMLVFSGCFGALAGYVGAGISAAFPGFPAGSLIVLSSGGLFCLSFVFAPRRGLCIMLFRRLQLRLRIAVEHALRTAQEAGGRVAQPESKALLFWMNIRGLLRGDPQASGYILTDKGASMAASLESRHRFWEEYIQGEAGLSASHAHISADFAEHVVTEGMTCALPDREGQGR